jgi:hypothetical protein
MQAYWIDCAAETIEAVELPDVESGIYPRMRELFDGRSFESSGINMQGDFVTVTVFEDEDFETRSDFYLLPDFPHPLSGKILITGTNLKTGDTRSPALPIEWYRKAGQFVHGMRMVEKMRRTMSGFEVLLDLVPR